MYANANSNNLSSQSLSIKSAITMSNIISSFFMLPISGFIFATGGFAAMSSDGEAGMGDAAVRRDIGSIGFGILLQLYDLYI